MTRRVCLVVPLLLISGCAMFQSGGAGPGHFVSADVLRSRDEGGLVRNDLCTVTDSDQLTKLQSFFPDMFTQKESTLHSDYWYPLVVIRFHCSDGSTAYLESDYRIYRVGATSRGLFVCSPDFIDFADNLPYHPAPPRPPPPGPTAPPPTLEPTPPTYIGPAPTPPPTGAPPPPGAITQKK